MVSLVLTVAVVVCVDDPVIDPVKDMVPNWLNVAKVDPVTVVVTEALAI